MAFDFDALEAAEESTSPELGAEMSCGSAASASGSHASPANVPSASERDACRPEDPIQAVSVTAPATAGGGQRRLSKARAWFEIRRFFDAEPQRHYRSPDGDEWKTYYAKELILKQTCEQLQEAGYVVIDA